MIAPALMFSKQGPLTQINGGVTLDTGVFTTGVHYRHAGSLPDALIGSIGLKANQLRIGYSFDYIISGFPLSGGSHEIGLVYHLDDGDTESRYNDCLRLFR